MQSWAGCAPRARSAASRSAQRGPDTAGLSPSRLCSSAPPPSASGRRRAWSWPPRSALRARSLRRTRTWAALAGPRALRPALAAYFPPPRRRARAPAAQPAQCGEDSRDRLAHRGHNERHPVGRAHAGGARPRGRAEPPLHVRRSHEGEERGAGHLRHCAQLWRGRAARGGAWRRGRGAAAILITPSSCAVPALRRLPPLRRRGRDGPAAVRGRPPRRPLSAAQRFTGPRSPSYHTDPSGTCTSYKAMAIGAGYEGAMNMLQEGYSDVRGRAKPLMLCCRRPLLTLVPRSR